MTREQERILRDLATHLMNRIGRHALDTLELCETTKIPQHDATLAVTGTLLFMSMDLMHTVLPSMTPREFGVMAEQHFTTFLAREERKSR